MLQIIWLVIALLVLLLLLVMVATLFSVKKTLEKMEEMVELHESRLQTTEGMDANKLATLQEEIGLIESHLRTINRNVYVVSTQLLRGKDQQEVRTEDEARMEETDG